METSDWNEASELKHLTHWLPLPSPPDDVAAPAEQQAAHKTAPGEQNTVPAEWLEQAYREGWAACRDAETIGEEAEDWAFGNSTANSRMIDAQQAAPQPAPAPLSNDVVRDAAFEAVRKKLCALPRFSFLSDGYGVRRVPDKSGSWIAFDAAHALFDPVAVDAALAAQGGK